MGKWLAILHRTETLVQRAEIVVEVETRKEAEELAQDVYYEILNDDEDWETYDGDGQYDGADIREYDPQRGAFFGHWRRNEEGKAERVEE